MEDSKNWIWLLSPFIIAAILPMFHTVKTNNCEYDIDFTRNFIKVICNGSSSSVNVYAETAHVSREDEVEGKGHSSGHGSTPNDIKNPYTNSGSSNTDNTKMKDEKDGRHNNPMPTPEGRRRSNKELRSGGKGGRKSNSRSDESSNHNANVYEWDMSKFDSPFASVVWNATQKLDDAKQRLKNYAGSLRNISTQLNHGDLSLRTDMDNLRRTSNTATELKEGIIAAMRNQYNFMKSALLTHNHQLVHIMKSLDAMVDVTSDSLHSALMAHKSSLQQNSQLNTTLSSLKKMVTAELRKRHRRIRKGKKDDSLKSCPKEISAIGAGSYRKTNITNGALVRESYTPHEVTKVWIMKGSNVSEQILEFDTAVDIDYGMVARYITLPYSCKGTGHAMFKRYFYCYSGYEMDFGVIKKYNIKSMTPAGEVILPGTNFSKYRYKSRLPADVDLAVDELGLWAIYATDESDGKMVISKLDKQQMEVQKTWITRFKKSDVGNAFMICGVLYATDSHSDIPTFIRYRYDTETSEDKVYEVGQLSFLNSAEYSSNMYTMKYRTHPSANSVMLSYDYRTSVLISWSNGKIETFPVYFKNRVP